MKRLTVSEFAESVGLNGNGTDYVGAGVMLRLLQSKGLAKEVKGGRRDNERGRPKQLYEIADSVYDLIGGPVVVEVKTPKLTVAEILQTARTSPKEKKEEVQVPEKAEVLAPEKPAVQEHVAVASSAEYIYGDEDD